MNDNATLHVQIYDFSALDLPEGSTFERGFYYDIICPELPPEDNEPHFLAGPYPTSHDALAAGRKFIADALEDMRDAA